MIDDSSVNIHHYPVSPENRVERISHPQHRDEETDCLKIFSRHSDVISGLRCATDRAALRLSGSQPGGAGFVCEYKDFFYFFSWECTSDV